MEAAEATKQDYDKEERDGEGGWEGEREEKRSGGERKSPYLWGYWRYLH